MDADERRELLRAVREVLEREADAMLAAARSTREAATHEEAKPENDKDTRALEASYLAGAQAERVRELRDAVAALDALRPRASEDGAPVGLGALCALEDDAGRTHWYLVAPDGGGARVEWRGRAVAVVTPRSPLGRALVGRRAGDDVEVATERGAREYSLIAVE